MKKKFWSGLILVIAFLIIFYLAKQIILLMTSIWKHIYYLIVPLQSTNSLIHFLDSVLILVFSLVCSLLTILAIGLIFEIKIRGQALSDILLKYFSRIPGIRFLVKLIHQIVESSQSFNRREVRLAVYDAGNGQRKLGIIKPREVILAYTNNSKNREQEIVVNFWQGITPYPFSGIPSLVLIENVYEVTNISYEDYLKYLTTGGLFFKLPKELKLKSLAGGNNI